MRNARSIFFELYIITRDVDEITIRGWIGYEYCAPAAMIRPHLVASQTFKNTHRVLRLPGFGDVGCLGMVTWLGVELDRWDGGGGRRWD